MDLISALDIKPGSVVAFVGAGGKTTAIWYLLRSLVARGERVIFTTTTQMFKPRRAPLLLDPCPDAAQIALVLVKWSAVILAAGMGEEGDPEMAARSPYPATPRKLTGLKPEVITDLAPRLPGITWLVEADGARGRALKVPTEYEPVIPSAARRVVVMGSLTALGRPLDESTVHRAERAAALLGVPLGTPITSDMVAGLLGHVSGGLKSIPSKAAVAVLLTQTEEAPRPEAATVARQLLLGRRIRRVVLANLRAANPVLEVWK